MPSLTTIAGRAYEAFGGLDPGGTLTAATLSQAQAIANSLLDSLSSEKVMAVAAQMNDFPLTANQSFYAIGPGLTWNMGRPAAIMAASVVINPAGPSGDSLVDPLKICNAIEWASIPDRESSSWRVRYLFYDRGFQLGGASVHLSPVPLGGEVEIISWLPFTQFADVTTSIIFPPGFQRFFELLLGKTIGTTLYRKPWDEIQESLLQAARNSYVTLNQNKLWPMDDPNETGAAPQPGAQPLPG